MNYTALRGRRFPAVPVGVGSESWEESFCRGS